LITFEAHKNSDCVSVNLISVQKAADNDRCDPRDERLNAADEQIIL
jgi:hypothetical protein